MLKGVVNANMGEGFKDIESRKDDLIDAFQKNYARHIIVIDKAGDEVDFHEHGMVGQNIIKEYIDYIDANIRNLFFGTQLALGNNDKEGGSYALGKIHERETSHIKNHYKNKLINTLNRDLLNDILKRNWSNFRILGIPKEDLNTVKLKMSLDRTEDVVDEKQG
jgi:phage gp29-like protein